MARKSSSKQGSPSFFKILLDPSAPHLPLPPSFVRRHLKDKIPKNPKLRLRTGEFSWQLKIKETNGNYSFYSGWDRFVKDTHLGYGDFLVIWLIDHSTFEASIYGPSGCEKNLSSNYTNICDYGIKIEDETEEKEDVRRWGSFENSPHDYPSFQKIISSKTHKSIMRVPREFVEEAGIEGRRSMIVKDLHGREWSITLNVEANLGPRYYLSKGWPVFRQHNQLSDGDICLFKFNKKEGKLMLTQVIKKKGPRNGDCTPPPEEKCHNRTPKREEMKENRKEPEMGLESELVLTPATGEAKRKRGRPPLKKSC